MVRPVVLCNYKACESAGVHVCGCVGVCHLLGTVLRWSQPAEESDIRDLPAQRNNGQLLSV